jgi:hypothetical protein
VFVFLSLLQQIFTGNVADTTGLNNKSDDRETP